MAKIFDITDKLNFEEKPKLAVKGKIFEVNDSAIDILKIMPVLESGLKSSAALLDVFTTLFDEKAREEITAMKLDLNDFSSLVESALEAATGSKADDEGETKTPATT